MKMPLTFLVFVASGRITVKWCTAYIFPLRIKIQRRHPKILIPYFIRIHCRRSGGVSQIGDKLYYGYKALFDWTC